MLECPMFFTRYSRHILVVQEDIRPPDAINAGGQLFYTFLIFILVLVLAYYLTKAVSKKRIQVLNTKNIKILELVSVGVGVSMGIIRVSDKYLLVSISKERVSLITELDENSLDFDEKGNPKYDFSVYFKKLMNNNKGIDENGENFKEK